MTETTYAKPSYEQISSAKLALHNRYARFERLDGGKVLITYPAGINGHTYPAGEIVGTIVITGRPVRYLYKYRENGDNNSPRIGAKAKACPSISYNIFFDGIVNPSPCEYYRGEVEIGEWSYYGNYEDPYLRPIGPRTKEFGQSFLAAMGV
jgi:hypothetical protein